MRQKTAVWLSILITSLLLVAIAGSAEWLTALASALDAPVAASDQAESAGSRVAEATAVAGQGETPTKPTYVVSAGQAVAIARKAAPLAALVRGPELVNLQGTAAYEVVLNRGKVYVDADSGALLYNGAQVLLPTVTPTPMYAIAPDQAAAFALKAVPGAALISKPELVDFQGKVAYEVVLSLGKVYIDPNVGNVLYNGAAQPLAGGSVNGPVNEDQAVQIANTYLQNNGNSAEAVGVRFGRAQGMRLFEITFADATRVYVNARTGEIVAVQTPNGDDD
jgi:uncharacterized membrane protein YkoI